MAVYSDVVRQKIDEYWQRLVEEKKLDIIHQAFEASKAKAERRIDVDTLEHKDARDIGAEWLCLQAIRQIGFDRFLRSLGWSDEQVKTDLNLRPIYHQKDDRSDAHLFLGLLSYWIVNVIRHQMKRENERRKKADPNPKAEYPTPYWTEIVRIMSTQKAVTSEAVNAMGEKVEMRICSTP